MYRPKTRVFHYLQAPHDIAIKIQRQISNGEGILFLFANCITQWMNYMTSTVLVSKFVQHPSKINVASEHTIVAKCLGDTMDRRTKKTPDKQLVNFFDVRTLVTYYP
jgi:hypothetical protein